MAGSHALEPLGSSSTVSPPRWLDARRAAVSNSATLLKLAITAMRTLRKPRTLAAADAAAAASSRVTVTPTAALVEPLANRVMSRRSIHSLRPLLGTCLNRDAALRVPPRPRFSSPVPGVPPFDFLRMDLPAVPVRCGDTERDDRLPRDPRTGLVPTAPRLEVPRAGCTGGVRLEPLRPRAVGDEGPPSGICSGACNVQHSTPGVM